jgi:hypothetical protein
MLWRRDVAARPPAAPRSTERTQLVRQFMTRHRLVAVTGTRTAASDRSIDACSCACPPVVPRLVTPSSWLLSQHWPLSPARQRQTTPARHRGTSARSSAFAAPTPTQSP